ncbi:MAG: hypothetical protein ACREXU_02500, partial [Gammaproteobacteria bacterium]
DKLAALKARASQGRGRREFRSPEELGGEVIHALADLKEREQTAGDKSAPQFHPPSFIPRAPAPYIAHPYTLLQTRDLVGRQRELNLLTDWVTKPERGDPRLQPRGHRRHGQERARLEVVRGHRAEGATEARR